MEISPDENDAKQPQWRLKSDQCKRSGTSSEDNIRVDWFGDLRF